MHEDTKRNTHVLAKLYFTATLQCHQTRVHFWSLFQPVLTLLIINITRQDHTSAHKVLRKQNLFAFSTLHISLEKVKKDMKL